MKRIGITLRVEKVLDYNESRDCIDQRWVEFIYQLGFIPVLLPNISVEKVSEMISSSNLNGILLSGGNSLSSIGDDENGVAIKRDEFEFKLLKEAINLKLPVVGICRGMQLINQYFGGKITKVSNHIAVKHSIKTISNQFQFPEKVNSFHQWGISTKDLACKLESLAVDNSGYIEALRHKEKNILGLMWHPERMSPFDILDLSIIKRFYQ